MVESGMACVMRGCRLFSPELHHWGSPAFLREQLKSVMCHVLVGRRQERRFGYWTDLNGQVVDRVSAGYPFRPPVQSGMMSIDQFFSESERGEHCVYLQHAILQAPPPSATGEPVDGMAASRGMGKQMLHELDSTLDLAVVRAIATAGSFGAWSRMQLFIGGPSANGARTNLHFDQCGTAPCTPSARLL